MSDTDPLVHGARRTLERIDALEADEDGDALERRVADLERRVAALEGDPKPPPPPPPPPPGRLGLHVTTGELAVWRLRAAGRDRRNFHHHGDVYTNSPGDWARIVASVADYMDQPPGWYAWEGPTYRLRDENGRTLPVINDSRWPSDAPTAVPGKHGRRWANEAVRDAAFYCMVTGSEAVDDPVLAPRDRDRILARVRDDLLTSVHSNLLDWSWRERFNPDNPGPAFGFAYPVSHWIGRAVFAYDYSQIANPDLWTDEQRSDFIGWLLDAVPWFTAAIDGRRNIGTITTPDGGATRRGAAPFPRASHIWKGGPAETVSSHKIDNHVPAEEHVPTLAGELARLEAARSGLTGLADDDLLDRLRARARWQIRQFLVCEFAAAVDGDSAGMGDGPRATLQQMYRSMSDRAPNDGWKYGVEWAGHVGLLVDLLARGGDLEPAGWETTDGIGGITENGVTSVDTRGTVPDDAYFSNPGPKNLHRAVQQAVRWVIQTGPGSLPWRFGHATSTDPDQRIDAVSEPTGDHRSNDWEVAHLLPLLRDSKLTAILDRSADGAPPHGPRPRQGQYQVQQGDRGYFAGANFMWLYLVEDHPDLDPYDRDL